MLTIASAWDDCFFQIGPLVCCPCELQEVGKLNSSKKQKLCKQKNIEHPVTKNPRPFPGWTKVNMVIGVCKKTSDLLPWHLCVLFLGVYALCVSRYSGSLKKPWICGRRGEYNFCCLLFVKVMWGENKIEKRYSSPSWDGWLYLEKPPRCHCHTTDLTSSRFRCHISITFPVPNVMASLSVQTCLFSHSPR